MIFIACDSRALAGEKRLFTIYLLNYSYRRPPDMICILTVLTTFFFFKYFYCCVLFTNRFFYDYSVRVYGPGIEPTGPSVGAKTNFTVETFSAGKGTVNVVVENPKGKAEPVRMRPTRYNIVCYDVMTIILNNALKKCHETFFYF